MYIHTYVCAFKRTHLQIYHGLFVAVRIQGCAVAGSMEAIDNRADAVLCALQYAQVSMNWPPLGIDIVVIEIAIYRPQFNYIYLFLTRARGIERIQYN